MTKEQKFLLLVVLIIAGASVTYYYTKDGAAVAAPGNPVVTTQDTTTQNPTPNPTGAVRSLSADTTYNVPEESKETVHVTISLTGDTINEITFTTDTPKKRESKENIKNFERALSAMSFKGTKLSDISLSRTGGASLTTAAFMDAVGKIRAQATNG